MFACTRFCSCSPLPSSRTKHSILLVLAIDPISHQAYVSAKLGHINCESVRAHLPSRAPEHASVRYSTSGSFAYIAHISDHVFKGCSKCWKKNCTCKLALTDILFVLAAIKDAPASFFSLGIPCSALANYFSLTPNALLALYQNDKPQYTTLIESLKGEQRLNFRISAQLNVFRGTIGLKTRVISFSKA